VSDGPRTLVELEDELTTFMVAFKPVGSLLAEIRDRQLWAPEFPSFEAYMDARWGPGAGNGGLMLTSAFHQGALLWEWRAVRFPW